MTVASLTGAFDESILQGRVVPRTELAVSFEVGVLGRRNKVHHLSYDQLARQMPVAEVTRLYFSFQSRASTILLSRVPNNMTKLC